MKGRVRLFSVVPSGRTSGVEVFRFGDRLPTEALKSPPVEMHKTQLTGQHLLQVALFEQKSWS